MADAKISALPASTTPLAGTEVLPIVQGTTTKQVSIANVTAGRAVAALSLSVTGTANASSLIPTGAPSSNWAFDGTNSALLVTIANDATYDLAAGSGIIYAWDNGGNGVGVFYTYYGTQSLQFNPQVFYSTTQDALLTMNFYFNGSSKFRFQNKTGSSKSLYIVTIRTRASA
jgi:hypothetical protein